MNKFGVWVLAVAFAVPAASQTKMLAEKSRIVTTIQSSGAFGLPTGCDDQGRMYVKLNEPGKGAMSGSLVRVSPEGVLEARFETAGALTNAFGIGPRGGIAVLRRDGETNVVDSFAANGKREASTALQKPPAFVALQIALFRSGEIFIAGGARALTAAVYDPAGRLIKQLTLDADNGDTGREVAVAGDDGYVYLLRSESPATVFVISSAGELVRKLPVRMPANRGARAFASLHVVKGKMLIDSLVGCSGGQGCKGRGYVIADTASGATVAEYFGEAEYIGGAVGCYIPDPDRFVNIAMPPHAKWLELIEVAAQ